MLLSRSERRSLTIIACIIAGFCVGVVTDRLLQPKEPTFGIEPSDDADSLEALIEAYETPRTSYDAPYAAAPKAAETFAFDPNTADSTALLRLGLAPWQVRAIYKYRSMGGRYHRPEDFKRVPGMTPEVYERLAPSIHIGRAFRLYSDEEKTRTDTSRHTAASAKGDFAPPEPGSEKFREMVILDLNSVDTATLKRVPGIGSYRARRIVEYRERLGGFASVSQLSEIENLPPELRDWFSVESAIFAPLRINSSDVGTLARHPYLSYAQARAILQYRHNYGAIKSLDDLRLLDTFTGDDLRRLEPYVTFE